LSCGARPDRAGLQVSGRRQGHCPSGRIRPCGSFPP
jgi:hypothetical protein